MKLRTLEAIYHYRRVGRRALSLFLAVVMMFGLAAPALSMTIAVVNTESAFSSGELFDGDGSYSVRVNYDESAQLPEDVRLVTSEVVDTEAYLIAAEAELAAGQKTVFSRFFEISLIDAEGNPIQPAASVGVVIETSDAPEDAQAMVFHYPTTDLSTSDDAVSVDEQVSMDEQAEDGDAALAEGELANAELEGLSLESSLGLKKSPLRANRELLALNDAGAVVDAPVVEGTALPIAESVDIDDYNASTVAFMADGFSVYGVVWTIDFNYEVDGKTFEYSLTGGSGIGFSELLPAIGVVDEADVADFISYIDEISFSNAELVWIDQVSTDTTVGDLIASNAISVEYSAELTEEEIAALNEKQIAAGDFALIGVKPFLSEETLTITMRTGDSFTVLVTDAQISAHVITADGKTFKITVRYDDNANIPEGTKLLAEEIAYDSEEYLEHLAKVWDEVNKEYLEVEELRKNYNESMGFLPEVNVVNLGSARFFDVKLVYRGDVIEPDAPVHVEISYDDGLPAEEGAEAEVAHFSGDGLEIIEDVQAKVEDSAVVSIRYEQKGFSDIGTYLAYETHAIESDLFESEEEAFAVRAESNGNDDNDNDSDDGLDKPQANKTLVPNKDINGQKDGTYTLTLSVSGTSKKDSYTDVDKSNVLIVMDRSSSMVSNYTYVEYTGEPNNNVSLYGVLSGAISDSNRVELRYYNGGYQYYSGGIWGWRDYSGTVYTRRTRLAAEQDALASLIAQLTGKNQPGRTVTDEDGNTISLDDIIEVKLISFASGRTDVDKANEFNRNGNIVDTKNTTFDNTESDWGTTYNNGSTLYDAVADNSVAKGTNWEEAMEYAKEVADAKKAAQPDEQVYIIFLTDGEPTDIHGDNGNAQYYLDNVGCLQAAEPDAKAIVDPHTVSTSTGESVTTDHKFYGIFTYGDTDTMKSYLRRLVNYAYGKGDVSADNIEGGTKDYYFDANDTSTLLNAFQHILSQVSNSLAYGKVSITDGLTTDAMTTTLVHGQAEGYKYTVTGPIGEVYSVTATSPAEGELYPTVTFTINGHDYPGERKEAEIDGTSYEYWSYTYGSGDDAVEYKITLADVSTDGNITWDLTGVGTLVDGYTYSASFIVWPNQEAYDYVAGLNNGLPGFIWNDNGRDIDENGIVTYTLQEGDEGYNPNYKDLSDTKGYEVGGVEEYPSIVKLSNGTYAVLTNTDQQVHYSIVKTKTEDGETVVSYDGPYDMDLPTPNPMPLEFTGSWVSKIWNISRDPEILARVLYEYEGDLPKLDENGNLIPKEYLNDEGKHLADGFYMEFDISIVKENGEEETYRTVRLGWDDNQHDYVWYTGEEDDETQYTQTITYGEGEDAIEVTVGTKWQAEFSIAAGLMLSTDRMNAIGLDKTKYDSYEYDGVMYYILEKGHDYKIQEPALGYEYDFISPTYHPMLVDGELENVVFGKEGSSLTIEDIKPLELDAEGKSSLDIVNTLRGYIHLNKVVIDPNRKEIADDNEFEFTVELSNVDAVFEGSHIPWYGINSLFYHDEEGNYYQARPNGNEPDENGNYPVVLTDEDGNVYDGFCIGESFKEDVGPQTIEYTDDEGTVHSIELHGNQMDPLDKENAAGEGTGKYRKTRTVIHIRPDQQLNIANVPTKTVFSIVESNKDGYQFESVSTNVPGANSSTQTITGTITPNADNNIVFTNQTLGLPIELLKIGEDYDTKLKGVQFRLYEYDKTTDEPKDTPMTKDVRGNDIGVGGLITTDNNGHALIGALAPGKYALREVITADGYNMLTSDIIINVTQDLSVTYTQENFAESTQKGPEKKYMYTASKREDNDLLVPAYLENGYVYDSLFRILPKVEDRDENLRYEGFEGTPGYGFAGYRLVIKNWTGYELPSTGGGGTAAFTIAGLTLAITSGAILTKRRAIRKKDYTL